MKKRFTLLVLSLFAIAYLHAQSSEKTTATLYTTAAYMQEIPPLSSMTDLESPGGHKAGEEKRRGANMVVPGKGLPHGTDPLAQEQLAAQRGGSVEPILTFDANTSSNLQDPTGAIGPNHFVNAWNSGFRIYDTDGNALTNPASLGTLFPGETLGDPCVIYDRYADRFVIMQFSNTPNGILVAVCQGPDPVNDGWYTYRFNTGSFPDYEKISVWSDGYYITANKDSNSAGTSEVVYALERDEMLIGTEDAQFVGFPLPGITTSGFYSPAGFNSNGPEMPPVGSAPIIYMQDDSWLGVSEDHLKIWNIEVDWDNAPSSTISAPQELPTTPFDGVFDGGSFSNITQPNGTDIDALQATVMYMAQYRRFADYNACVLNWVVDLDGNDDLAGIRWVELRQDSDGDDWTIFQEGTYAQPDGLSAFCGGICMDANGNIGLGYTVTNEEVFPSIRFTGRYANDPLGVMTVDEGVIGDGTANDPSFRYGDYGQMTIDPVDDKTFWHIGEYFIGGFNRTSRVGAFKLAPDLPNDVGIINITAPTDGALDANEEVTVTVRNFGINEQTDVPVSFQIDGGTEVSEILPGPIASGQNMDYTFTATGDFSIVGTTYTISASTSLASDENAINDSFETQVTHLFPNDLGVVSLVSPQSSPDLSDAESITVTIENFGGSAQSGFEISYSINGDTPVTETVAATVPVSETIEYTFDTEADFNQLGDYELVIATALSGDIDPSNDAFETVITKSLCQPQQDCTFGDGIHDLELGTIDNFSGCNDGGYADFTNLSTNLARGQFHDMTITTNYGDQNVRAWIDFDDNFNYDFDEVVLTNYVIAPGQGDGSFTETMQIEIPGSANLGEHLMRVKTNWDGLVPSDPCSETEYGETEDYTVIVTETDNIFENLFGDSEMIVETSNDDQFTIRLITKAINEPILFTVHNVMGQRVVHNWVEQQGGEYVYQLDMSYAASGAYLVRFGNSKGGKIARIVVR